MATHVVQRAFTSPTGITAPGLVVDASGWRNSANLVSNRYIVPLPNDASPASCPCGLSWIDGARAALHGCQPPLDGEPGGAKEKKEAPPPKGQQKTAQGGKGK